MDRVAANPVLKKVCADEIGPDTAGHETISSLARRRLKYAPRVDSRQSCV